MTTDPIADMLTRMRNAIGVDAKSVDIPNSRQKRQILKVLKETGFIEDYKVPKQFPAQIKVQLAIEDRPAKISHLRRLSTPGRRFYVGAGEIPIVRSGQGLVIVSTSVGVMAGHVAKARRLGGELICEIY